MLEAFLETYFLSLELNRFLIALSVRPGSALAISHQRLPCCRCITRMRRSSSCDHFSLRMLGSRWLCHLSLHCLPMRPGSAAAIALQFLAPCSSTICLRISSSSLVQGPLETKDSFFSSSQRLKHYISDLPGMHLLTLFQRWSPNLSTRLISLLSYREYIIANRLPQVGSRAFSWGLWRSYRRYSKRSLFASKITYLNSRSPCRW